MDTKLKKYDRYYFTRLIAVVLVIIITAYGSLTALNWIYKDGNADNLDAFFNHHFSKNELYNNDTFNYSYYDFCGSLCSVAGIYGDGSKEAYNRFMKVTKLDEKEEKLNDYKSENSKALQSNYYYTRLTAFSSLQRFNEINVRQIGVHGNHFLSAWVYVDSSSDMYVEDETDVDDNEAEFDGEDVTHVTQLSPEYAYSSTEYDLAKVYNQKNDVIPTDIANKAKATEIVVSLCNAQINGTEYDGYYAVSFSDDDILSHLYGTMINNHDFDLFISYSTSYNEFKKDADSILKSLRENKLFHYAVVDGNTVVYTDIKDFKNLNAEQVEQKVKNQKWHIYTTESDYSSSGEVTGSYYPHVLFDDIRSNNVSSRIFIYADDAQAKEIISESNEQYSKAYESMKPTMTILILCIIFDIICFAVVIALTGKVYDSDEIRLCAFDKIPLIIKLALLAAIVSGGFYLTAVLAFGPYVSQKVQIAYLCVDLVLCALLLLELICYLVKNFRAHRMSHRFVTVLLVRFIIRKRKEKKAELESKPLVYINIVKHLKKKFILGVLLVNALALLIGLIPGSAEFFVFCLCVLIVYDLAVLCYALSYAKHISEILAAIREIRNGNYTVRLDVTKMPKALKKYAQDINTIGDSVKEAVEKAVKEQNTKTELITNVSHDLKTPLTSIINYVDLLSKCEPGDPKSQEYLEILEEKSAKLKTLIEDLIEASKAQTGNITVVPLPVNLKELVSQIAGEYDGELMKSQLKCVISAPDEQLTIYADSKLSHRVLDNLFNNAVKYAMPGTRIYLSVFRDGNYGSVTLRNVSAEQLNIPASELMSRFVRGDSSRSTSGNGLGLSIAENLCKIQGGRFGIAIDGDLFTAKVDFPLYFEPQSEDPTAAGEEE